MSKTLFSKLLLLVAVVLMGAGSAWADEVTIASFTASTYNSGTSNNWVVSDANYATAGGGYYQLTNSEASIVTPAIDWSNYTDITITIKARKYGGPDATQGKISVNQESTELTSYSPSSTTLTNSSALSISPSGTGSLTIACLGASSNKGCGVSEITIKGTAIGGSSSAVATTTTIDASGITNTDVYVGTEAGSLSATVKDDNSDIILGATVTWSGNNDAVATIDATTGAVTLVAAGTVTFTATYAGVTDEYESSTDTYKLTVTDSTPFSGGDVTFEAGTDGVSGETSVIKNGVTLTIEGGGGIQSSDYRTYKNATLTISTNEGKITNIEFICTSSNPASGFTTISGFTTSGDNGTWTGDAKSVTLTAGNKQVRATKIVVTVAIDNRTEIATIGELTPTTVNIGDIDDFTLPITPAATTLVEGTDYIVVWETSDAAILDLADETYEAKAKGTVDVTVTVTPVDDVTYSEVSKTFTVRVVDPNANDGLSEAKAFTCAEAIEAIDGGVDANTDYYVKGIINTVQSFNSTDNTITYWIADDGSSKQFEIYHGLGLNGAEFTDATDLEAGDIVVVKGKITKYNATTYEFSAGSQLVSLTRPVVPTITLSTNTINVDAAGATGEITVTYENFTVADADVVFFEADGTTQATYSWITASINASNNLEYTIEANDGAARTAYMKVYALDASANDVYSDVITITQAAPVAPVVFTEFYESFDSQVSVGGNNGDFSSASSSALTTYGDWTLNRVYPASLCVKVGSSSGGSITTPELNLDPTVTYVLTFKAAAWGNDYPSLTISSSEAIFGGNNSQEMYMNTNLWTGYYIELTNGTSTSQITFTPAKRFFLDEVRVMEKSAYEALAATKTVGSNGWATYIPDYNVEFVDGDAYVVTAVDETKKEATLTAVTSVPAKTPVLLKGTGDKNITVLSDASVVAPDNLLTISNGTDLASGKYNWVLAKEGSSACFKQWTGDAATLKGKTVLVLDFAAGTNARPLTFVFDDETTTGISNLNVNDNDVRYYDLQGRRVAQPQKGLYIINGKKVVVK